MLPHVTAIIPAYKATATIARAIDSLLAQQGAKVDVVVVVDGPDAALEAKLGGYDPRVTVLVLPENRGVQVARNRGLAEARGEWLLFLDADDYVSGDLLCPGARLLAAQEGDLGLAAMIVRDEVGGAERKIRLEGNAEALFAGWLGRNEFVAPCSVLWRASAIRRIGGWDEALQRQEDGEMVMRALLLGARVAHLPSGHGVYVQHSAPDRLTAQTENLRSLLDVPAKLLTLEGAVLSPELVQRAAAQSYANAARTCLLRGRSDFAGEALRRLKALGGARPQLGPPFGALYRLLPLRAAVRAERAVRVVLRRPY